MAGLRVDHVEVARTFERHELGDVACLLGCFHERGGEPEGHLIVIGPVHEDLPNAERNSIAR